MYCIGQRLDDRKVLQIWQILPNFQPLFTKHIAIPLLLSVFLLYPIWYNLLSGYAWFLAVEFIKVSLFFNVSYSLRDKQIY